ncbi:MAG: multiheme c-type cytochrome, partial [Vicinamibacterales bacterium]|nr:multiheme c-type cytochrome [Vicinamibacterales bacterium]
MTKPLGPRFVSVVAVTSLMAACAGPPNIRDDDETATFVGRAACAACHEAELRLWEGSHHDLAMQIPDSGTVLGDFDDATLTHFGITSTFFRQGDAFVVRTEGPDGGLLDYPVAYTFGVDPLQQYLVEFPGGRLQALSVAWDARPADAGGQRWFHLYPDERIASDDPLHWTGSYQNWNFMCAECHSTNLEKNFDLDTRTYDTTFSEIDVSCEACHGPASQHVALAEAVVDGSAAAADGARGLAVSLKDRAPGNWIGDIDTGLAERTPSRESRAEVETCARCHARRAVLTGDYVYGRPLMDSHRPALLDEQLYHAD